MFNEDIQTLAESLLEAARQRGLTITAAESCTGGLVMGALTAIAGSSDVVDRGFVTYTNEAKQQMLGVNIENLERFGAVSNAVAKEMAYGALANSMADIAVSITGIAGPGGGSDEKPVGTVWFAIAQLGEAPHAEERHFNDLDRDGVRNEAVKVALSLLLEAIAS
ncbi:MULTISPECIES: CinA family protein [Kordiimonas]|uniref:CinA family protein n=1 Tax=Kordiimonas TaxID=288021 RepID=UPI001FF27920|nr:MULTISPECIES: CinA family protein [Kordiimonas]MCK0071051.1 CinA family protein [Kordiimonas laminariae]UTW57446.1 CinA family protein [Kordiimonas sp. SCSIO 12603]